MKINGIDIKKYGAKQFRMDIGMPELKNESEWQTGAILPNLSGNAAMWKQIDLQLMVYGDNREQIRNRISNIEALMLEPIELELDGTKRRFRGILQKASTDEGNDWVRERRQKMKLQIDAYEHGEEVQYRSGDETLIRVTNPGNMESPVRIEITPRIGLVNYTINGVCRDSVTGEDLPIIINDLTRGKKIIIDGIDGIVEEEGAGKNIDLWALPSMPPGGNVVTVSNTFCDVTITVLPMYV